MKEKRVYPYFIRVHDLVKPQQTILNMTNEDLFTLDRALQEGDDGLIELRQPTKGGMIISFIQVVGKLLSNN